jgi:anti-repressor protein
MEQIIKITEQDGQQTVSARDLHTFLNSKKDFSDWIKHRIKKYGLVENQDYTIVAPLNGGAGNGAALGGFNKQEYALTMDAAKELAMVEGNAKGKQARQYFIACEKALKDTQPKVLTTRELAMLVLKAEDEKEQALIELNQANETIQKQAPKVEYVNKVLASDTTYNTTTVAKELGMGAQSLNKKLYEKGIQYLNDDHWVLYAQHQNKGYTVTRTHHFYDSEGKPRTSLQTVWTEKGRAFIHRVLNPALLSISKPMGENKEQARVS